MEGNESAESGGPPSKTIRAQWTAFIERHAPQATARMDLQRRARIYNKVDEVGLILRFLDSHEAPGFLPWKEYERFRKQFGVTP